MSDKTNEQPDDDQPDDDQAESPLVGPIQTAGIIAAMARDLSEKTQLMAGRIAQQCEELQEAAHCLKRQAYDDLSNLIESSLTHAREAKDASEETFWRGLGEEMKRRVDRGEFKKVSPTGVRPLRGDDQGDDDQGEPSEKPQGRFGRLFGRR